MATALALALAEDPNDGDSVIRALRNVSFAGTSGQVNFTSTNDRDTSSLDYVLFSYVFDNVTKVLTRNAVATARLGAASEDVISHNEYIIWRGGSFVQDITTVSSCAVGYVFEFLQGGARRCVG